MSYQRSDSANKVPGLAKGQRVAPKYYESLSKQKQQPGYNGRYSETNNHFNHKKQEEEETSSDSFGKGKTILVVCIVIGCFAVLWPKIFVPIIFGRTPAKPITDNPDGAASANQESNKDSVRSQPSVGKPPPVRTIDKEWGGRGPMPGMRPTMGGPGVQQQQPKGGGTMGTMMPIFTVGIVVFFIYTTMKVMFKNKNNDEEDEDETNNKKLYGGDNNKYNEEYYNEYIRQYKQQQEINRGQPEKNLNSKISNCCLPQEEVDIKEQIDQQDEQIQDIKGDDEGCENYVEGGVDKDELSSCPASDIEDVSEHFKTANKKVNENDNICPDEKDVNGEKELPKPPGTKDVENKSGDTPGTVVDPRDLEISLLKARLEETDRAMANIVAHLGNLTSRLTPHLIKQTEDGSKKDAGNENSDKNITKKDESEE